MLLQVFRPLTSNRHDTVALDQAATHDTGELDRIRNPLPLALLEKFSTSFAAQRTPKYIMSVAR
ncbi:hypothetical protein AYO44_11205 [Planctomycetaceae bacterium SCGC AG-212-F19]|nr:hypothetical protein AYO44_11205 [Planctomycetaceae bacterium SCGC AG-212-F19]